MMIILWKISIRSHITSISNFACKNMALTVLNRRKPDHHNALSIPLTHQNTKIHTDLYIHNKDQVQKRMLFFNPIQTKIHFIAFLLCMIVLLTLIISAYTKNTSTITIKPRMVLIHFDDDHQIQYVEALRPYHQLYRSNYHWNLQNNHINEAQIQLEESQNNNNNNNNTTRDQSHSNDERHYADPLVRNVCVQQYDWQLLSFPTCNILHEHDLLHSTSVYIDRGHYRDVWSITKSIVSTNNENVIYKTLRYKYDIDERNLDRNRKDALAMERLTFSKYTLDIYSYCANAGFYEYGDQGTLESRMKEIIATSSFQTNKQPKYTFTPQEKITIAFQVASALVDTHHTEKQNQAALTHGDIKPNQFLYINGTYKLNDFNRGRLLAWNQKSNQPCRYKVDNNKGTVSTTYIIILYKFFFDRLIPTSWLSYLPETLKNRSPEEYKYTGQDEKIDIYSMGNIFYYMITFQKPYHDEDSAKARDKIIRGNFLSMEEDIVIQTPVDKALKRAMQMCHVYNPRKRATAKQVQDFLRPFYELHA